MKTAAIYARVSTSDQVRGTSLDGQIESCRAYAKANDLTVTKEVREDASGASLARAGLDSIRDLAAKGELDTVIVFDPDRLSRALGHLMLLSEEFERQRVALIFVNSPREDTPEGRMLFGMKGLFAEFERTKIMERTRRGKERRAREGKVLLSHAVPYGYTYIVGEGRLEINEAQAVWVRSMYEWIVNEHCTLGEAARRLYTASVPTQTGNGHWRRSSVQRVLSNQVNAGTWHYNKRRGVQPKKATNAANAQKKWSKEDRPRNEWIGVPVPAIVSVEMYDTAMQQLQRNRELSVRNVKHEYLLRGFVVCGY